MVGKLIVNILFLTTREFLLGNQLQCLTWWCYFEDHCLCWQLQLFVVHYYLEIAELLYRINFNFIKKYSLSLIEHHQFYSIQMMSDRGRNMFLYKIKMYVIE